MKKTLVAATLLAFLLPFATSSVTAGSAPGSIQRGKASYYHDSLQGRKTASGQPYNKNRLSAAHKTLPLGTRVRVTDTKTGRSIVVKVNDRGPFVRGRIIDLSKRAARELGIIKRGVANVKLEVVSRPSRSG